MGCITLLSDFGLQDASVASAKGVLMQYAPNATIVDITHWVEPFHLQQAAYLLLAAYKYFPAGTCHVLLFDIFYEKQPRLILCEKDGHYFLAPDNGLLSLAFGPDPGNVWNCFELRSPGVFYDWLNETGKMVNQLQIKSPQELILVPYTLKNAPQHCQPKISANSAECQVIHIDRYENVIINITKQQFESIGKGRPFRIQFMRDEEITELSTHYYNTREGEKLCRFNATGYLEIAINRGKAASLLGFRLQKEQHIIYNTIKIFFE
ncbi:MAG TPA: SAM-dependent chlorinase/fluorinase [Flavipsychrobacter sp.]|nr:SAM-dependent chlorinase/fluorinase [Flavipsychrobacter sp.]